MHSSQHTPNTSYSSQSSGEVSRWPFSDLEFSHPVPWYGVPAPDMLFPLPPATSPLLTAPDQFFSLTFCISANSLLLSLPQHRSLLIGLLGNDTLCSESLWFCHSSSLTVAGGYQFLLYEVPHPHHALCQPSPCTQANNQMLVLLLSLRLNSQCISKCTFVVNNLGRRNKSALYTPLHLLLVVETALNLSPAS